MGRGGVSIDFEMGAMQLNFILEILEQGFLF